MIKSSVSLIFNQGAESGTARISGLTGGISNESAEFAKIQLTIVQIF
ncbi:MAG: hypothetical protein LBU14_06305 [Candidatus Peribacteria bacterium]|nr:hypothetical protein [Candidatus Peribacteria bacterium]